MPVENITESMHDEDKNATWLSIYDGRDFYRVHILPKNTNDLMMAVYDYNNELVKDEETISTMRQEASKWVNSQTIGCN